MFQLLGLKACHREEKRRGGLSFALTLSEIYAFQNACSFFTTSSCKKLFLEQNKCSAPHGSKSCHREEKRRGGLSFALTLSEIHAFQNACPFLPPAAVRSFPTTEQVI